MKHLMNQSIHRHLPSESILIARESSGSTTLSKSEFDTPKPLLALTNKLSNAVSSYALSVGIFAS